jgi:decaprenyl-phosphate phosphoribosyltransferase
MSEPANSSNARALDRDDSHQIPVPETKVKTPATIKDYFRIMRPDYWLKNIFIAPGILFAIAVYQVPITGSILYYALIGTISACLVASANYVINEFLDAEYDKFHPLKNQRSFVVREVNPKLIYLQYFLLVVAGLGLASLISFNFLIAAIFLLFMGGVYNVPPIRSKERVFLDVLSESINNPIRFAFGWFMVVPAVPWSQITVDGFFSSLPPLSIVIAYWMGGAFLMATKRFAEYRLIGDPQRAGLYRKSFRFYTENKLLISMFFYALTCAFFLGIFLIKHRIEMLLSFPFFALLFAWYLKIGLLKNSPVQGTEKLYTQKWFMLYLLLFTALFCTLMFVDIPALRWFLSKTYE